VSAGLAQLRVADASCITVPEAAKLLGCCKRMLLTEYIRRGLLPYPDPKTMTWPRDAIDALVARFDAERKARPTRVGRTQ
jgi:hypothetical protein